MSWITPAEYARRKREQAAAPKTAPKLKREPTPKSSQYTGVYFDRWARKWKAQTKYKGVKISIGRFDDEQQAAQAYQRYRAELQKG